MYPSIEPYRHEMLSVSSIHTLYVECCGNPKGIPVVFLHGGPGGGCASDHRRYFNPELYHIILFDQRGCGRSTPFADLRENTTWDLVSDIEKLRQHLKIDRWAVFGGSWGSTLALAYAQNHPEKCLALFLRGIFLLRKEEIDWFYQEGASKIFPDAWEPYMAMIAPEKRSTMVKSYYELLTHADPKIRVAAARTWSIWEGATSKLLPDADFLEKFSEDQFAEAFARIECHYFINKGFFDRDDHLLHHVSRIRHLPAIIVQGRYDVVCPMKSAWDLHKEWPEATLKIISDAGHSLSEKGITQALIRATDEFAKEQKFS